ncbi:MAG TPA: protein arginine kinase [Candidatus Omnitrophica bacterium]|nr:MAG: protein arginine kinase [Omnitrophica WOR_2 bacterium GWA2_63_20]OGX35391.1 MAG: protein arginine kinase [Omnitrophica WOR_2 bacterium RIFCSPHIGHO2_02_FULL_63_39]OGX45441.1 MAG: protein arginine kinase [Omnitrophica WOR_2 bacterium RIFCSPLOWO2_02_FULL_63_16]OGX47608.1 MAG: protein arginine kinase [Omnitrophica WOR_2 bacterium RIFCSPLOWO2_12_FULL_63_16]HBH96775.1 protein arginine kinase [Candidatus Omnitrophota bacterium]
MPKELDALLTQTSEWLRGVGPSSEIVMSSRIRLARNLEHFPFATRATDTSRSDVLRLVQEGVRHASSLRNPLSLELGSLDEVSRQFLVERHLISREHASSPEHRGVVIGPGEVISVMINEEDHLRVQVMQSGLSLREAWALIDALDDELSEALPFAYSSDWGYLTCCLTNAGTGLRASVMVHLPALVITKQINKVLHAITKLGLTARGLYGEGTEALGNFFQMSNQVSLGRGEEEIVENIERIMKQVIGHEQTAREGLTTSNRLQLEDRIWRAYGVLRHAQTITSNETLDLLSAVRLGVDVGIMTHVNRPTINDLLILSQPAHLQKLDGSKLSAQERDSKRAGLIRQRLNATEHDS